ncbi:hypothetical protein [Endozoicomonas sp. GU-1]|uniref:hypothetical protein n=1 Tax=Endozoicomonas sp. GU-1 TaxID=3009078 RepID=UPI0022B44693|nr:hypothetical protein [Endozoicomonas sp. GU-1]WBA88000.1 hypothetical protein O3276_08355 [Endozoicomonas sp. GU-1]
MAPLSCMATVLFAATGFGNELSSPWLGDGLREPAIALDGIFANKLSIFTRLSGRFTRLSERFVKQVEISLKFINSDFHSPVWFHWLVKFFGGASSHLMHLNAYIERLKGDQQADDQIQSVEI